MRTTALIGIALAGSLVSWTLVAPLEAQILETTATQPESAQALGETDRLVWTAAALEELLAERDYPSVLLISALGRGVRERGEVAFEGLGPLLSALSMSADASPGATDVLECRDKTDLSRGTLCSMERLVPISPPALARDLTEEGARLMALASPGRDDIGVRGFPLVSSADALQSFAGEALEGLWWARNGAGEGVRSMAPAFDELLAGIGTIAPPETAAAVLARAPALRRLLESYPVISERLASPQPIASVTNEYQAFLASVTGSLDGLLSGAAPNAGDEPTPLVAGATSLLGGRGEAGAAAEWATGRSFVYLASQSAELAGANQGVRDRMLTLGTAAVDLQRGAAGFPAALADMGRDLAVAALSGNVLGVASRITSFFGGTSGALGPEAAREVQALREGMDSMRGELRTEFDEMDQRVDDLFGVLETRFALLEVLVDEGGRDVRRELGTLHESVLALGGRLESMDVTLKSYMQAGFDRDYTRTLVRCLEHRERYVPPWDEIAFEVFLECLADFRVRAVVDARDALLTDQATPLDDLALASALADLSPINLAHRLPLLGRTADQRFGYRGVAGGRALANMVEWAVACEAYLTLLRDWPQHARAVSASDLQAMRSVGLDLRRALRGIAADPSTGARAPLVDRVLGYYQDRLVELTGEADALARRHRQETLLRVSPETVLVRLDDAEGVRPSLAVPEVVSAGVPPEVRTAAVLGLDEVTLAYRLTVEDSVIRGNARRRFLMFGRRHDRFTYTRTSVAVELRSSAMGVIGTYRASGPFVLRRTEEMDGDDTSDRVHAGVDHISDPADQFLTAVWPAVAGDPTAWTIEPVEPGALLGIESRIEAELKRHATTGLNNVFAAVCSEPSGGVGLSELDRASALRIRSGLHGLSAARVLLEAYIRLARPDAFESDTNLRDALLGPASILDRSTLCDAVASGESALRLVWLEEEPARRASALQASLDAVLESRAAVDDMPTRVDPTLERLDTAIRVQRLRAAVAAAR